MLVTSEHLNYLQRIGLNNDPTQLTGNATATFRKLIQINGYAQFSKDSLVRSGDLPSKDILTGLYGSKTPVAFFISGSAGSVDFYIGTWSTDKNDTEVVKGKNTGLDQKAENIKTVMESGYAAIDASECTGDVMNLARFSKAGLVMGVPTIKSSETLEAVLPVERLIRTMNGLDWGCLVLAQPVNQNKTNELRLSAIDEMKRVAGSSQGDSPLASYYNDALNNTVIALTYGLMGGNWRTGVYLMGDENSYTLLSSAWIGIFSGEQSYPDTISLLQSNKVLDLAKNWELPLTPEITGPGRYQHPLKYQTLLNSSQLSAYIHLPQRETTGFAINTLNNFDTIPPKTITHKTINLGLVFNRSKPTQNSFLLDLDKLNGHVFVSGITGCGKTNTIFQILTQSYAFQMPFLVIEPAKNEYSALLSDRNIKEKLLIFTPGDEMISPFRLNPFEVVAWPFISISKHIDLLRSVFTASFGMWDPLPQILEKCLFAIYEDRGWDITTNTNSRLDKGSVIEDAFPTLSDLADKANQTISGSDYASEVKDNMRTALLTRINSLRIGGKGRMLDVQNSFPMQMLLENPTVLELEGLGDDDDKAFIMGLLFIRLVEYRTAQGENTYLQHLLVIEEAHRLLTNVEMHGSSEQANPKGKAVEAFSNLISEIRAYGQGIIVADQVPVKLAPDVIKNTNIKIIQHSLSGDDRRILAESVAMTEDQSNSITSFLKGDAAIYSDGALCQVHIGESSIHGDKILTEDIITHMVQSKELAFYRPNFDPVSEFIGNDYNLSTIKLARELGQSALFQDKVGRMVLSTTEDDNGINGCCDNLTREINQTLKQGMDFSEFSIAVLFFASQYYANLKGSSNNWTYAQTGDFASALRNLLFSISKNSEPDKKNREVTDNIGAFRKRVFGLYKRSFEPFLGCSRICSQQPSVCLYRQAVSDFIASSKDDLYYGFDEAYDNDNKNKSGYKTTMDLCNSTAKKITGSVPSENTSAHRVAFCVAQHLMKDKSTSGHDNALNKLLAEAPF